MLICSECHNEQKSGKFCGKCGSPLIDNNNENMNERVNDEQTETTINEDSTSNTVDNYSEIMETVANYGEYFFAMLKNPTKSFTLNENSFIYGVINTVLYILTFAMSVYFLINTAYKLPQSFFGENIVSSLPFFPILSRVSISLFIIVIVTLGAIFSLLKLMAKQIEFKQLVVQYGSLFTPFIVLNIISWLTGLSGAFLATAIILLVSFMFTIYIIPGFIIYELDSHTVELTQKVYLSFGAILLAMIMTYIVARIIVVNYLEGVLDALSYLF